MVARMRITAVCFGAVVVLLSPGCQQPQGTAQDRAKQQNRSASPKAAEAVDPALVETPKIEISTYVAAGRLHESQGRLVEAVQQYQFALKEDPKNVELLGRMGMLYDRMNNGAMAERMYLEALQLAPNDARLHNNLAFSCILRKKWKDAEGELTRAIELAPTFARARVNLGMVLAQQERFDEAFKQFEMALPVAEAWYNLGLMYQSKRRTVDAAWAYKRALELNSKLVAAKEQLSRMPSTILGQADQKLEDEREAEQAVATAEKLVDQMAESEAASAAAEPAPAEPVAVENQAPAPRETALAAATQPACEPETLSPAAPQANAFDEARWPTMEQSLSQLDALLPTWDRSPEAIREFSTGSPWLTDAEYTRFDWAYSPSAVFGIAPDPSGDLSMPWASTQPE